MKRRNIANIFVPLTGKWRSYTLKHWHGKRVKYRGHYGKIVAAQLDRDMNFLHWIVLMNKTTGKTINLNDPNYIPS